jgi:hypothetical protein
VWCAGSEDGRCGGGRCLAGAENISVCLGPRAAVSTSTRHKGQPQGGLTGNNQAMVGNAAGQVADGAGAQWVEEAQEGGACRTAGQEGRCCSWRYGETRWSRPGQECTGTSTGQGWGWMSRFDIVEVGAKANKLWTGVSGQTEEPEQEQEQARRRRNNG